MAEKLMDVNSSVFTSESATPKMQAPSPFGGGKSSPKAKEMDVNKSEYTEEKGVESEQIKAYAMK